MSKSPSNHGKSWSGSQDSQLRNLAKKNTPTRLIGLKMGRTPDAVYSRASDLETRNRVVPLSPGTDRDLIKPVNQSPYGTKKR